MMWWMSMPWQSFVNVIYNNKSRLLEADYIQVSSSALTPAMTLRFTNWDLRFGRGQELISAIDRAKAINALSLYEAAL